VTELFLGRRDLDEQLTSAQTAMMLQEDSIKRADDERRQLVERFNASERSLSTANNEIRLLHVTVIALDSCFEGRGRGCDVTLTLTLAAFDWQKIIGRVHALKKLALQNSI